MGQTFYFKFVVRARNALESQGFGYYCSVQVVSSDQTSSLTPVSAQNGLPTYEFFQLENLSEEVQVEREKIDKINGKDNKGFQYFNLRFTVPVKMKTVETAFSQMFTYTVKRSDFDKHPSLLPLESLEALSFNYFN